MQSVITVPKESVGHEAFVSADVLTSWQEVEKRKYNLQKAVTLGNLYRHKVSITYFLQAREARRVVTTVWAVTEKYVTLKGGRNIPIRAISDIEL